MLVLAPYDFNAKDDHWAFGHEWGRLAKWLVESHVFALDGHNPISSWDPLYAFVIVPFFQVFGIYTTSAALALLVFQSGLCAATTWTLFLLAEKLYGPFEARATALGFACYPASIFFALYRVGPASLIVLLISVLFLIVLIVHTSQSRRFALLAGVIMGLLVLTCSKTQSLLLIIPLWLWLVRNGRRVGMVLCILLFLGGAVLTSLPWSIRNALTLGEFSPSRSDFAYHLWRGNNPRATGYWYTSPYTPEGITHRETLDQSQYLRLAMGWIVQHPKDFIQLTLKRITHFWYKINEERRQRQSSFRDTVHTMIFMVVLGLAFVGLFWVGDHTDRVGLLLLFLLFYPLIFYVTHVTLYRYRYPIEPFILILASHGFKNIWCKASKWMSPSSRVTHVVP
jgi:uncharacterized membrane protein